MLPHGFDEHLFDPASVHAHHREAVVMGLKEVAHVGHAAGEVEHEATQRVPALLLQLQAVLVVGVIDIEPATQRESGLDRLLGLRFFDWIGLVGDLAH